MQVYNWTDAPVIVSRNHLLFLDPHHRWSPGGPVYDFVGNSGEAAIKNHMAAFQSVMERTDQYLAGTVIRIPLRTEEQAKESKIWKRAIKVSEMDQSCSYLGPSSGITDCSLCGMLRDSS